MDRNDQGRYRERDESRRHQSYPEREGERRWEEEGGSVARSDDNRRWSEGDQSRWQPREEWRTRDDRPRQGQSEDDRWGRFPADASRAGRSDDEYRRESERDWRARYYPSSGTYGSSSASGTYGPSPSYRGERSDRDYRGSYDDSPSIYRESRPGARPYQQASGQAGQDRYRYEEQLRRGRPPRTYKRSDDRIHDEICELVARDSDVDASEVDVKVESGEVTFTGTIEDRRSKRELEDIAERVFGVVDIHNNVRVRRSLFNELGERIFGSNEDKPAPGTKSQTSQKM
jgi:osmotically-inducible protein OsmY